MGKQTARNGKIDLLRFVFSVCIVLNHAKNFMPTKALRNLFAGYSFGVEFFFLVSGYLMMATIQRAGQRDACSLGRETGSFLWRKFKSLYPELLVGYAIGFVVAAKSPALKLKTLLFKSWFEVFGWISTGLTGLDDYTVLPVSWYVSSMLLCMAVLYPLIRKHKNTMVNVVLPLTAALVLGYMLRSFKTIRGPLNWTGTTMRGNLRALAELSLGALCYEAVQKLKNVEFSKAGRIVLGIGELCLYAAVFIYMATEKAGVSDLFFLALLCAAVILSFSGKSIGHERFNNKVCTWLGKYSLSIYCSHYVFSEHLGYLLPVFGNLSWQLQLTVYLAVSLTVGLGVMGISNLLRRCFPGALAWAKGLVTNKTPVAN